jgi:hypothetical protein
LISSDVSRRCWATINKAIRLAELFAPSLASTTTHAHPLMPKRSLDLAAANGDWDHSPQMRNSSASFLA